MSLDELRNDIIIKQKKGLPFIMASVIIWLLIVLVSILDINVDMKNLLVFCCSCPLLPLAWLIGNLIKVDIFSKQNPLGQLGFIFTLNQMIYLLIVMWVFSAVPKDDYGVCNGLWRTFTAVFMAVQIKGIYSCCNFHSDDFLDFRMCIKRHNGCCCGMYY